MVGYKNGLSGGSGHPQPPALNPEQATCPPSWRPAAPDPTTGNSAQQGQRGGGEPGEHGKNKKLQQEEEIPSFVRKGF